MEILDVSVVIANYNHARYISQCIKSLISDQYTPNEIIVVDDGSTDDSRQILESLSRNYKRIKLIFLDKNVGFGNALNLGIEKVVSKYVARIDPDDYGDSRRLVDQVKYLDKNAEVDVLGTNAIYFNNDRTLNTTDFPVDHSEIYQRYLNTDNGVLHGTVMIRSEVAKAQKYRQDEVPVEDYGYFSRLISSGHKFRNLKDKMTYVRIHDKSVTNSISKDSIRKMFKIREEVFAVSYNQKDIDRTLEWIRSYRCYLSSKGLMRYVYLFRAITVNPAKVAKRVKQWSKSFKL